MLLAIFKLSIISDAGKIKLVYSDFLIIFAGIRIVCTNN